VVVTLVILLGIIMALLPVVYFPDSRLKTAAEPVSHIDETIRTLVENMYETMYHEKGVGLAANQVGILLRIFVMDVSDNRKQPICAINPEIISQEGVHGEYEGCLSFPGAYDKVERSATLRFKALDLKGDAYEMAVEGLMAQCVQHEIDHLNGMLFVDRLSRLKQERARKKFEKFRRSTLQK
jgi:peptide deformylase